MPKPKGIGFDTFFLNLHGKFYKGSDMNSFYHHQDWWHPKCLGLNQSHVCQVQTLRVSFISDQGFVYALHTYIHIYIMAANRSTLEWRDIKGL